MQGNSRYIKASSRINRRSKLKSFIYLFFIIGLPIILLVSTVLVLRADFLQIKSVEVVGNVTVSKEAIQQLVVTELAGNYFFVIPKSNYLFLKKEKVVQKLLTDLSRIESVEINKNINGVLEVNLKERQADFVWCSTIDTEDCYFMGKDGFVFTKASKEEILGKIIFRGNLTAKDSSLSNYLKAIEVFKNSQFEVLEINLVLSDKVIFKTDVGDIFLNPAEDLALTATNAVILINEVKTKTPSVHFDYIDARFGNKVFYKLK